jgi:NADPH-dependent 2,4-dienoyl-CoA reductase/sulfur reductase-like enzyme
VPRRVEHWSNAIDTAKRAGPALVAGNAGRALDPRPFAPVPSFWSDQFGLRIQSFGMLEDADQVEVLEGDLSGEFVAGYRRAGRLWGVAGIGLMPSLLRWRAELIAAAVRTS